MAQSFTPRALIRGLFVRSREPNSSVIDRLEYNWLRRSLQVTFKKGAVYTYQGVPWRLARQLEIASGGVGSIGQLFNANIRNVFTFTRAA